MKEIVNPKPQTASIDIEIATRLFLSRGASSRYICYITSSDTTFSTKDKGTGIALYVEMADGKCGFVYHRYLLQGQMKNMKYEGRNVQACVNKALAADKKVLYLDCYEELLSLCARYPKH